MYRNAKPDVQVLGDAHQGNLRARIGAAKPFLLLG